MQYSLIKNFLLTLVFLVLSPVLSAQTVPQYAVDASWPADLPNNWILGQVAGIAVDSNDHIWIVHRPKSLSVDEMGAVQDPPWGECCVPAPAVLEFDQQGNLLQGWGGSVWSQSAQSWSQPETDWPLNEHGIFVDSEGFVWLGGNQVDGNHIVTKFQNDGSHVMTIGIVGETGGSNDTERLGRPADIAVDTVSREVYVADGYLNRRVIVFDSDTGEYKRHWGAYGGTPDDESLPVYTAGMEPARQFMGPVHGIVLGPDNLLYVADRTGNRVQVFERDGSFVKEALVAPWTLANGSAWDLAISTYDNQRWLFVVDGRNFKIWILERDSLETVGAFGRAGRQAGQFEWVHNVALDSDGNLYTSEVNNGRRIQKFSLLNE